MLGYVLPALIYIKAHEDEFYEAKMNFLGFSELNSFNDLSSNNEQQLEQQRIKKAASLRKRRKKFPNAQEFYHMHKHSKFINDDEVDEGKDEENGLGHIELSVTARQNMYRDIRLKGRDKENRYFITNDKSISNKYNNYFKSNHINSVVPRLSKSSSPKPNRNSYSPTPVPNRKSSSPTPTSYRNSSSPTPKPNHTLQNPNSNRNSTTPKPNRNSSSPIPKPSHTLQNPNSNRNSPTPKPYRTPTLSTSTAKSNRTPSPDRKPGDYITPQSRRSSMKSEFSIGNYTNRMILDDWSDSDSISTCPDHNGISPIVTGHNIPNHNNNNNNNTNNNDYKNNEKNEIKVNPKKVQNQYIRSLKGVDLKINNSIKSEESSVNGEDTDTDYTYLYDDNNYLPPCCNILYYKMTCMKQFYLPLFMIGFGLLSLVSGVTTIVLHMYENNR